MVIKYDTQHTKDLFATLSIKNKSFMLSVVMLSLTLNVVMLIWHSTYKRLTTALSMNTKT